MLTADCPDRAALQSKIDSILTGFQKKIKRLEALDIPVNFDTLFEVKTAIFNCNSSEKSGRCFTFQFVCLYL